MLRRTIYAVLICLLILAGCETPPCVDGWVGAPPPKGTFMYCVLKMDDGRELRHGPYTRWYISGQMSAQGQYLDGKEEGVWTYWYYSGRIHEQGSFLDGKREGRWNSYYADGSPWKQSDYDNGELHDLEIPVPAGTMRGTRSSRVVT
jgi:hypothetical protein